MKRSIIISLLLIVAHLSIFSQYYGGQQQQRFGQGQQQQRFGQGQMQQGFSPEKFNQEMQEFITKEAHLTQQEAALFFPVYHEMQQKQRALYDRQRQLGRDKPQDEKGCLEAIRERDEIDISLRQVQQTYHNRFLEMLPASKVYDIIKAEERFHRRMMRNWTWGGNRPNQMPRK